MCNLIDPIPSLYTGVISQWLVETKLTFVVLGHFAIFGACVLNTWRQGTARFDHHFTSFYWLHIHLWFFMIIPYYLP